MQEIKLGKAIIWFIMGYQKYISPILNSVPGRGCRFYPSCSEYSKQCFEKYPFYKAFLKTIWRIVRCNPFSKGGSDLVS
jgi:putative membrane protein insertion efficiency factor